MGFSEVSSLDADVTVALGKVDKKTGKAYPKQAEGYYLGKRDVENKRGTGSLHFLQTAAGNLGIWGTTDLNRKLSQVVPGTMVRVTSTGTKPTPNGDMYTYKVEVDKENTIEVESQAYVARTQEDDEDDTTAADYDTEETEQIAALTAAEKKAEFEALIKRGKTKSFKN